MSTRGDVQSVVDAFIMEETLYWFMHPIERVQTVQGIDEWDGYNWTLTRQLAQEGECVALKSYMDTIGERYLREIMEQLIQTASPRLYHEYWTTCPDEDPPANVPSQSPLDADDRSFVKTGAAS